MFEVRWVDGTGTPHLDQVDAQQMTVEFGALLLTKDGQLVAAYSAPTNWSAREMAEQA